VGELTALVLTLANMADTVDVYTTVWALVLEHTSYFSARVLYQTTDWLKELVNAVFRARFTALFRAGQQANDQRRQADLAKMCTVRHGTVPTDWAERVAALERRCSAAQRHDERRLRLELRYVEELSVPLFMQFHPTLRKECMHQFWCDEISPSLAEWLGAEECQAMHRRGEPHVLQYRLHELDEDAAIALVRLLTTYDVEALNTTDLVFTGHVRLLETVGKKRDDWLVVDMLVAAFRTGFLPMIRHVAPNPEPAPLTARLFADCIRAGAANSDETMAEFHRLWPGAWPSLIQWAQAAEPFDLDLPAWSRVLLRYEPVGAALAERVLYVLRLTKGAFGFYDYMVAHGYHTVPGLRRNLRSIGAPARLLERLPPEDPSVPDVVHRLHVGPDGRRAVIREVAQAGRGIGVARGAARPGEAFEVGLRGQWPPDPDDMLPGARNAGDDDVPELEQWHEPAGRRDGAEGRRVLALNGFLGAMGPQPDAGFVYDAAAFARQFQAWQDAGGFGQPQQHDD